MNEPKQAFNVVERKATLKTIIIFMIWFIDFLHEALFDIVTFALAHRIVSSISFSRIFLHLYLKILCLQLFSRHS